MKRIFAIVLCIAALLASSCAKRHKISDVETEREEEGRGFGTTRQPVDPKTLTNQTLKITETSVCNKTANVQKLATLTAASPQEVDYFEIKSCLNSRADCSNYVFLGEELYLAPGAGQYNLSIRSCIDSNHTTNPGEVCGPWKEPPTAYTFPENTSRVKKLVNDQVEARKQMVGVCERFRDTMRTYIKNEKDDKSKLKPIVEGYLKNVGVNTCVSMLLSNELAFMVDILENKIGVDHNKGESKITLSKIPNIITGISFILIGAAGLGASGYLGYTSMKNASSAEFDKMNVEIAIVERKMKYIELRRLDLEDKYFTQLYENMGVENDVDAKIRTEIERLARESGIDAGELEKRINQGESPQDIAKYIETNVKAKGYLDNIKLFFFSMMPSYEFKPESTTLASLLEIKQDVIEYQRKINECRNQSKCIEDLRKDIQEKYVEARKGKTRIRKEWKANLSEIQGKATYNAKVYGTVGALGGLYLGSQLDGIKGAGIGSLAGAGLGLGYAAYEKGDQLSTLYDLLYTDPDLKYIVYDTESFARAIDAPYGDETLRELEIEKLRQQKIQVAEEAKAKIKIGDEFKAKLKAGLPAIVGGLVSAAIIGMGAKEFALVSKAEEVFIADYSKLYKRATGLRNINNTAVAKLLGDCN